MVNKANNDNNDNQNDSTEEEENDLDLSIPDGAGIDDSVRVYLKEMGKVDLLDKEEEVELAKRIEQGDQEARAKLTEANLRLVVSIAKKYRTGNVFSGFNSGRKQGTYESRRKI